ncbi:MAG: D-glycero-beta-D-manno-heptose 1-phosphate adenylyltransferase [Candidatus Electryonea clarkiae]|nr:D-glycero-beta-D-manno-heptose 1-phosphate adenylyltransferase [Candidatus Electryonea clarkiae]MDP8286525.1 D-glycero-beta-D-manno-heptose 1-phosphate adenylyltransferase [Candidatus Electryonea clarkiae]
MNKSCILDWEAAKKWREDAGQHGKRIVFTNGVFDILHAGHLDTLEKARALGDALILGLNSDKSVQNIKGPLRPIVDEQNRAALLCGLDAVDLVVLFDEDTPLRLLENLKPDILVKGGDYTPDSVVGKEIVEAGGGRVEIIPLVEGLSTTNVVETVLERYCEKRKSF